MIIQITILAAKSNFNSVLKNPAYEIQRISQLKRRVAPILSLFLPPPPKGHIGFFIKKISASFGKEMWAKKHVGETNFRQTICFPNIFFVPKKVLDNKKRSVKKLLWQTEFVWQFFFFPKNFSQLKKKFKRKNFCGICFVGAIGIFGGGVSAFCDVWRLWQCRGRLRRHCCRLQRLSEPSPLSELLSRAPRWDDSDQKAGTVQTKKLHWEGTNKNVYKHCEY